jgi:hypothetical protein
MNNIPMCNDAIYKTFNYVLDTLYATDISFATIPTNYIDTSFRIVTESGVKMSICHSPDTGGELETILLDTDNSLVHDTLLYHENVEDLIKYILAVK